MKRTRQVNIRVNEEEYDVLASNASMAGMTVSEYVRKRALGRPVKAVPCRFDAEAVLELARIGSNLNQLARLGNIARKAGTEEEFVYGRLEELREAIDDILRAIRRERS